MIFQNQATKHKKTNYNLNGRHLIVFSQIIKIIANTV